MADDARTPVEVLIDLTDRRVRELEAILERLDRLEKKVDAMDPRRRRLDGTLRPTNPDYYSQAKKGGL